MILMEVVRWKNGTNMGGIPGGPKKLTVSQAIVSLLTYALKPEDSTIVTFGVDHIGIRSPYCMDVDMVSYDANAPGDMVRLLQAMYTWGEIMEHPYMGTRIQLGEMWRQYFKSCCDRYDAKSKYALFLAMNILDLELMIRLAKYDIEDIADAIDIMYKDPTVHWDDLIPIMVVVRPLR